MTTTTNDTIAALAAANARRTADTRPIIWNARPADRSRNGRRIPGSRTVRFIR